MDRQPNAQSLNLKVTMIEQDGLSSIHVVILNVSIIFMESHVTAR